MSAEPKATLERLLHHLGFTVTIEDQPTDEGVMFNIRTPNPDELIGHGGQTLADLQYLTNRLLFEQDPNHPKVTIDVEGYRSRIQEELVNRAVEAAGKVERLGEMVELEPMNAFDRWVVHNALKDHPGVVTQSVEVEGTRKKAILVRPRD